MREDKDGRLLENLQKRRPHYAKAHEVHGLLSGFHPLVHGYPRALTADVCEFEEVLVEYGFLEDGSQKTGSYIHFVQDVTTTLFRSYFSIATLIVEMPSSVQV